MTGQNDKEKIEPVLSVVTKLIMPRAQALKPGKSFLEWRYEKFLTAS